MVMVRDKVISLRIENPDYTLQAIGDVVGVTRERVRQILKGAGLPTVSTIWQNRCECRVCGEYMGQSRVEVGWLCNSCERARNRTRMRRYYAEKPQYFREYQRKNYDTLKGTARTMANTRFPQAQTCGVEGCNELGERHHIDYNRYYDILWLCPLHHKQLHNGKIKLAPGVLTSMR